MYPTLPIGDLTNKSYTLLWYVFIYRTNVHCKQFSSATDGLILVTMNMKEAFGATFIS